jgi:hypothetical protein
VSARPAPAHVPKASLHTKAPKRVCLAQVGRVRRRLDRLRRRLRAFDYRQRRGHSVLQRAPAQDDDERGSPSLVHLDLCGVLTAAVRARLPPSPPAPIPTPAARYSSAPWRRARARMLALGRPPG